MSDNANPTPRSPGRSSRVPLPRWATWTMVILVVASFLPLVFFAKARVQVSDKPRVHFFQDMATQPRYGPQMPSGVFADGRAMRPRIAGTVARGRLDADDHYYRGFTQRSNAGSGKLETEFYAGLPSQVRLDAALLRRGQQRYGIYCASCHGLDGYAEGPVTIRAGELGEAINPSKLHDQQVRDRPDGHLFNTITNGIRLMPAHGGQIPVSDRWAIVAYVRALQFSQRAPAEALPASERRILAE